MSDLISKKNPIAKALSDPKFKPRTVKAKKGKGSYHRLSEKRSLASRQKHAAITAARWPGG